MPVMPLAERQAPRPERARRGPGWVPNQHGAWAMLASPLLLGALAGGLRWIHLLLGAFWFSGYFAFFAAGLWLKSGRRARYLPPVRTYPAVAGVLGLGVLAADPALVRFAPLFAVPLIVGLYAAAKRHDRDLLAGLTTVVAAALMTVVAYVVGTERDWGQPAWPLAAGQLLYFGGTVCFVKSVIRERGEPVFRAISIGWHLVALGLVAAWWAMGNLPGWAGLGVLAVFALLLGRAIALPRISLSPKQIGIIEIVFTVAVALLSLAVS